jgi:uncharacterized cupin superfamily protein
MLGRVAHPKIELTQLPTRSGTGYPRRFHQVNGDIPSRQLQPIAVGLTAFGANRVVMPPGAASSLRHYHSHEDELVIVLSGELVMLTDEGETPMRAGDIASFPKGVANAHCFVNRSSEPAVFIAVGNNHDDDECFYPDVGMRVQSPNQGGKYVQWSTGEPFPDVP